MKNLIRLLSCFSLLFGLAQYTADGQNIENGNFCIGNNAGQHEDCWYFNDGDVPNWFRSHGTPQWEPSPTGSIKFHHSGTLFAFDLGEGIVGRYNFIPGITYTIEMGLLNQLSGNLNIEATSGISEGPLIFHECTNNASIVSYSQIEHIHTASLSNSALGTIISVNYTPIMANNQIWIYFSGFTGSIPASFQLDYVKIWACETGSKHYPAHIAPNLTRKNTITTGSGSLPLSENSGNTMTTFIGSNIQLNPVTLIEATNDEYFIAIAVNECSGGNPDDQMECPPIDIGSSHKPGRPSSIPEVNMSNTSIHPNPTTGSFTLTMPQSGKYTVRVMNMMGAMVYEAQLNEEQQKSIQLKQGLPAGTYTIQVTGEGLRHVEKLILTK